MKKIIVFFFFFAAIMSLNAQQVIGSSGGFIQNPSTGSLSQTIGEPIIQLATGSNGQATQGFQQSDFMLVPVPVELSGFYGKAYPSFNHLHWTTQSERNNFGFDIERSAEGNSWEKIGFASGFGSTNSAQVYQFKDEEPLIGLNYYRLKQLDIDGTFEYSSILILDFQADFQANKVHVFPNPTSGPLQISFPQNGKNGQLQLFDASGNKLEVQQDTNGNLSLSGLAAGTYLLRIQMNGKTNTHTIIKY